MSEPMRPFLCRKCNERLTAPLSAIGRVATCHVCGEDMRVPAGSSGLPKGEPLVRELAALAAAPAPVAAPAPAAASPHVQAPAALPAPPAPTDVVIKPLRLGPPPALAAQMSANAQSARMRTQVFVAGVAAAAIAGVLCLGSGGIVVWHLWKPQEPPTPLAKGSADSKDKPAKQDDKPQLTKDNTPPVKQGDKSLPKLLDKKGDGIDVADLDKTPKENKDGKVAPPDPPPAKDNNLSLRLRLPVEALGSTERLQKLKAVRLTAKSTFASATNVNDIKFSWCWEPKIAFRFEEMFPEDRIQNIVSLLKKRDKLADDLFRKILENGRLQYALDAALDKQYELEARKLYESGNCKPFFGSVVLMEDREAYTIFDNRLALPLRPTPASQLRNLFFALSLSNLVPIERHKFGVKEGPTQDVKGRMCKQYIVQDPGGLKLQMYFDTKTDLLAKIAHKGHSPAINGAPLSDKVVFWEHYFSDYQETQGIKQWRRVQAHNDGALFATLTVNDVQFFDETLPELRRPPAK